MEFSGYYIYTFFTWLTKGVSYIFIDQGAL